MLADLFNDGRSLKCKLTSRNEDQYCSTICDRDTHVCESTMENTKQETCQGKRKLAQTYPEYDYVLCQSFPNKE